MVKGHPVHCSAKTKVKSHPVGSSVRLKFIHYRLQLGKVIQ